MAPADQDREIPAFHVSPENQGYFDAVVEGCLVVKYCNACNQIHFFPRTICPHCFSDDTRWLDSAGTGKIYTYSVSRRGIPVPFALAYVTLDEGVTMMSNIVDCDLDSLAIDMRVRVVFKAAIDGVLVPMFTPQLEADGPNAQGARR